VAPDTMRVTASIITEGESVEAARDRNAKIVQQAMEAIRALKLPNAETKTLNYTIERVTSTANIQLKVNPEQLDIPWRISGATISDQNFNIGYPITLGYRASNSLTVRVQNVDRDEMSRAAGRIVDALMVAGVNQITSVAYSLENDKGVAQREALTKATRNAQATAEAVATAAGRKIVGIRSINPSYFRSMDFLQNVQAPMFARGGMEGGGTPTTLNIGMLQVSAQVNILYDLEYNPGDLRIVSGK
jgi:uncharacterized protein YggE